MGAAVALLAPRANEKALRVRAGLEILGEFVHRLPLHALHAFVGTFNRLPPRDRLSSQCHRLWQCNTRRDCVLGVNADA